MAEPAARVLREAAERLEHLDVPEGAVVIHTGDSVYVIPDNGRGDR